MSKRKSPKAVVESSVEGANSPPVTSTTEPEAPLGTPPVCERLEIEETAPPQNPLGGDPYKEYFSDHEEEEVEDFCLDPEVEVMLQEMLNSESEMRELLRKHFSGYGYDKPQGYGRPKYRNGPKESRDVMLSGGINEDPPLMLNHQDVDEIRGKYLLKNKNLSEIHHNPLWRNELNLIQLCCSLTAVWLEDPEWLAGMEFSLNPKDYPHGVFDFRTFLNGVVVGNHPLLWGTILLTRRDQIDKWASDTTAQDFLADLLGSGGSAVETVLQKLGELPEQYRVPLTKNLTERLKNGPTTSPDQRLERCFAWSPSTNLWSPPPPKQGLTPLRYSEHAHSNS